MLMGHFRVIAVQRYGATTTAQERALIDINEKKAEVVKINEDFSNFRMGQPIFFFFSGRDTLR